MLQSTYNRSNPFKQSFLTVGVGQTEGISSVVIVRSCITIIISPWDREKILTKFVMPKVFKFYVEKGYLC